MTSLHKLLKFLGRPRRHRGVASFRREPEQGRVAPVIVESVACRGMRVPVFVLIKIKNGE